MKKFLSLVLALVMTMSLVTVSAGAKDFTDSSKIQYTEAVDVMSAVKVIDGYTDGSFNPTATLTRGAAAKIICNLILGPTTAGALVADAAPYKDVPTNHTFAGYIAYCQKEGIISGYADGTFKPANSLTGYAFMKMLLGALGYDAEVEGYTGPNWSVNVAKRALNIGLDDGLVGDFNGVKAVNREEACLYALNTLTADMVEYDAKTSVSAGNTTVVIAGSKAKEMVNNGTSDGKIFSKDGVMQFAEKYFDNLTVKTGSDEFERPANVWKLKAEEIGTYSKAADLTYTKKVEAGDIYKDLNLGSTVAAKDVTVYVNGVEATAAEIDIKKGSDVKIGKAVGTDGNGVLTEVFYDDDADTITITQVVTYIGEIAKTVKATDKKDAYVVITGKLAENNSFATRPESVTGTKAGALEFETDEKFADETYVLYTYSFKEDGVQSVVAAEKVEGYVSQTINKATDLDQNNGMTIAGTAYKMSKAAAGEKLGNVSVKQDYTVYLDQYGYIIYVEEIQEIGNYALVLATASKGSFIGNKAQILLTDGTVKFVNTDENYASGDKKIADNTIVTFRENSDGTYTLKTVKKDGAIATVKATGTTVSGSEFVMKNDKAGILVTLADGTQKTVTANSASVFVVADQDDYNVKTSEIDDWDSYTGIKNAPSVSTDTADHAKAGAQVTAYYYCKNSMVTVMFVVPNKLANVEDGTKNAIYFAEESASDLIHDEDGDYFTYNAIVDGKITTVKVDADLTGAASLNGLYKSYGTNSKGYITSLKSYPVYSTGNTEQVLNAGIGLAKTSKEYTVTLDTKCTGSATGKHEDVFHHGTAAGSGFVITVDDNAKIYFVDKKGNISESSYAALYPDDNDLVYAVVEDYLVKTLVVQEVKDADAAVTPTLKPGQKPVAYIDGFNVVIPTVDGTDVDNAVNVLANAGYSVTGYLGGTTYLATKNGTSYAFTKVTGTAYFSLTIDGEKVEYVEKDADSKTTKGQIQGKGTGYIVGSATTVTGYSAVTDKTEAASNVTAPVVIKTGYVTIGATQATSVPGLTSSTVTVTTGAVAYNKATVEITAAKANVTKDYTITVKNDGVVVKTFTAKKDTDIKETVSLGNLTADIADSKITVEAAEVKAPVTFTAPVKGNNAGLTFEWTLTNPVAAEGEKVTGTLTVTGTSTAASNVSLSSTGATAAWDISGDVVGKATVASNALKIESGVITNFTVNFEFTVGNTTVGTLTASYT